MTTIATTAPFLPLDVDALKTQLTAWNLTEDLAIRHEPEGQISVYALGGATSWPMEWTPQGDDVFEGFEISDFLHQVAQPGQSIAHHDSGGAGRCYISAHVAPTPVPAGRVARGP